MTTLTRWDPFREMMTLRSAMDRLFDNTLQSMDTQMSGNGNGNGNGGHSFPLALDVSENENAFVVQASVPGMAEDALDITLNNNLLTISGEFSAENQSEGTRYHIRERRYGRFSRSITLPSAVDADSIEANTHNGVLTIHIPKAEEAKPRRIAVNSQKTIEGQTA